MSSYKQYENDSEDEDVDYFIGREGIIFVIDAKLYRNLDAFVDTLDIIQKSLLSGLLTRGKDLIGVVLFNTENSPDPKDMSRMKNIVISPNNAVLLPLCELSKEIMEYFLNFTTPDYFNFASRYGFGDGSISNGLRLCTNMFKQCGYKLSTQNIVYFTDCDAPYKEDSLEFQKSLQKAKDLDETDIQFELVPMCDDFDYNKFFKEFLCMIQHIDIDQFVEPDKQELVKMISNRNLQQNSKKRCNSHLKWNLGDEVQISVGLYNYFKKKVEPKKVRLLRKNNNMIDVKKVWKVNTMASNPEDQEIISPNNTNIFQNCDDEDLKPSDTRKVLTVGGREVTFTCEEVARMRSPLPPGIRLLGFKDRNCISLNNFIKTFSFLYPDENIVLGSTILFRAIWEKCIEKNQVPICVIVSRRKTAPRFIALVPTENKLCAKDYDGFRITYLPFENEIRSLNLQGYISIKQSEEAVKMFEKIARKLKIKFSPDILKDPTLEMLEANIIGSAFDIEYEGLGEGCSPNLEEQDSRIEKVIENLADIFGQELEIAKKRQSNSSNNDKPSKMAKISEECPSQEQIKKLIFENELNILTIKQLKAYLQENNVAGLSVTKPKLIDKVLELNR